MNTIQAREKFQDAEVTWDDAAWGQLKSELEQMIPGEEFESVEAERNYIWVVQSVYCPKGEDEETASEVLCSLFCPELVEEPDEAYCEDIPIDNIILKSDWIAKQKSKPN